MNKFIGGVALAGLICIASAAFQSVGDSEAFAADPLPDVALELTVGSSPECPNYSSGILHIQASSVGAGGATDCLVAEFGSDNAANTVVSVTSSSDLFPDLPAQYPFSTGHISASIPITANSSAAGSFDGTVTLSVSATLYPDYSFDFTGSAQWFETPMAGEYLLEVWGAQGGDSAQAGGKGGYSSGTVTLELNDVLWIYVGSKPSTPSGSYFPIAGGYNGGGLGYRANAGNEGAGGGGGGASDIRTIGGAWNNPDGWNARIIVAGGGGGATFYTSGASGGSGGGSVGSSGAARGSSCTLAAFYGGGGTQSAGGAGGVTSEGKVNPAMPGEFGFGGNSTQNNAGGGGGGGWYGGGGGTWRSSCIGSGGGGSGYVGGVTGSIITAGNSSMPTHDGLSTMTGNTGHGYAKISYLG